jgi:hypothetical protein
MSGKSEYRVLLVLIVYTPLIHPYPSLSILIHPYPSLSILIWPEYGDVQNQEENFMEEDISMTQEELADDVRWEDSPGVSISMEAKPLTSAKRG